MRSSICTKNKEVMVERRSPALAAARKPRGEGRHGPRGVRWSGTAGQAADTERQGSLACPSVDQLILPPES